MTIKMTPQQLQAVADSLKDGDPAKAEFHSNEGDMTLTGKITINADNKSIGNGFAYHALLTPPHNTLDHCLTYLEKLPKPIPHEPPVGFGAFDSDAVFTQRFHWGSRLSSWRHVGSEVDYTWSEIYPNITRVHDLDGDIVEWDYENREWIKK